MTVVLTDIPQTQGLSVGGGGGGAASKEGGGGHMGTYSEKTCEDWTD